MRFIPTAAFLVLFILLLVGGCATPQQQYKETQFLMDTVIEITAYGPHAEEAVKDAFREFKRIHDLSNRYDPESQISRVNRAAGLGSTTVDADLIDIISRAIRTSQMTGGKFDISIGALTDLWGVGRKGEYVPAAQEIEKARTLVDYRKIQVDSANYKIVLPQPGMTLDLGGIAKRYAIDRAVDILTAKGIKSALINAGGDINAIGRRPDGSPWRIGVQHPRQADAILAKITMDPWTSVETSGDYQRFFMKDNVRYSHIIDPHSGQQPREIASVTIISQGSSPDIRSSAVFTLGIEKGLALLEKYPNSQAIIVSTDGKVITTPGLGASIELSNR